MLVLSRKVGESIQIGDDVRIIVNRISGNRITLAVDAPRSVKIVRGELADQCAGSKVTSRERVGVAVSADGEEATEMSGQRLPIAMELDFQPAFVPRNAR